VKWDEYEECYLMCWNPLLIYSNIKTIKLIFVHVIDNQCHGLSTGVDSLYHIEINMNVRRGIIWGLSVQSIHEGEVYFSLVCTLRKAIKLTNWRLLECSWVSLSFDHRVFVFVCLMQSLGYMLWDKNNSSITSSWESEIVLHM